MNQCLVDRLNSLVSDFVFGQVNVSYALVSMKTLD